jgi:hypothetical protein
LPAAFERVEQCSDTANKASELADYRVCTSRGILGAAVDSTAQLLDWCKTSAREDGIYAYYRMRFEERRQKQGLPPT